MWCIMVMMRLTICAVYYGDDEADYINLHIKYGSNPIRIL